MKEKQKQKRSSEPLSREMLLRRNPAPFGDVRKYYYAGMIGTIALLAVCFHVCVSAIVLRTDTCVQIPNGIVVVLLLCAVLCIVGHYSRTIAGYAGSAVMCLVIVLVLQFYNGGIALKSNLPDYGEVVQDGVKGIDFWILLAKVLAVVHMLLSVVFINSTLKVKEEPPVKGMNIKIKKFCEWFSRKDRENDLGWRPSQFWITCACLILWMLVAQGNPYETGKYDVIAMLMIGLGAVSVFAGKTYLGALCFEEGFLTCCTMYQLRFGWSIPTLSAYVGVWLALLFLLAETYRKRYATRENAWCIRLGSRVRVRIPIGQKTDDKSVQTWKRMSVYGAVIIAVLTFPLHEFLSAFSGSYMNQQKDNLPLFFFLPLVSVVCACGGTVLGFICSAVISLQLYDSICEVSLRFAELFQFNSIEQHGFIGKMLTARTNRLVYCSVCIILAYFVVCLITATIVARRKYERAEESLDS